MPPGIVRVNWLFEEGFGQTPAPEPDVPLEGAAQRVAAAMAEEAEATGFGQHVLRQGWHLLVLSESDADANRG